MVLLFVGIICAVQMSSAFVPRLAVRPSSSLNMDREKYIDSPTLGELFANQHVLYLDDEDVGLNAEPIDDGSLMDVMYDIDTALDMAASDAEDAAMFRPEKSFSPPPTSDSLSAGAFAESRLLFKSNSAPCEPRELPIMPFPNALFQGSREFLYIYEMRFRTLMNDADAIGGELGRCFTNDIGRIGQVGCLCEIKERRRLADGRGFFVIESVRRFRILRIIRQTPYIHAEVSRKKKKVKTLSFYYRPTPNAF
jgi:hypothetical protein